MSSRQYSQNWQRGINQYGNRYDHRGDGAAQGGTYHYTNRDGSYYYQNADGSTFYRTPTGRQHYTPPQNNPRTSRQ